MLGKTFLCAIFCCWKAILYPGSLIVIASKTRNQGSLVLKKIEQELVPRSPLLRSEIKDITINQSVAKITFRNDSVNVILRNIKKNNDLSDDPGSQPGDQ